MSIYSPNDLDGEDEFTARLLRAWQETEYVRRILSSSQKTTSEESPNVHSDTIRQTLVPSDGLSRDLTTVSSTPDVLPTRSSTSSFDAPQFMRRSFSRKSATTEEFSDSSPRRLTIKKKLVGGLQPLSLRNLSRLSARSPSTVPSTAIEGIDASNFVICSAQENGAESNAAQASPPVSQEFSCSMPVLPMHQSSKGEATVLTDGSSSKPPSPIDIDSTVAPQKRDTSPQSSTMHNLESFCTSSASKATTSLQQQDSPQQPHIAPEQLDHAPSIVEGAKERRTRLLSQRAERQNWRQQQQHLNDLQQQHLNDLQQQQQQLLQGAARNPLWRLTTPTDSRPLSTRSSTPSHITTEDSGGTQDTCQPGTCISEQLEYQRSSISTSGLESGEEITRKGRIDITCISSQGAGSHTGGVGCMGTLTSLSTLSSSSAHNLDVLDTFPAENSDTPLGRPEEVDLPHMVMSATIMRSRRSVGILSATCTSTSIASPTAALHSSSVAAMPLQQQQLSTSRLPASVGGELSEPRPHPSSEPRPFSRSASSIPAAPSISSLPSSFSPSLMPHQASFASSPSSLRSQLLGALCKSQYSYSGTAMDNAAAPGASHLQRGGTGVMSTTGAYFGSSHQTLCADIEARVRYQSLLASVQQHTEWRQQQQQQQQGLYSSSRRGGALGSIRSAVQRRGREQYQDMVRKGAFLRNE
ncbi:hypothetical protein CEUSTIGMA_g1895.t1 [Chlamydomonas eustigma]|uniref:Uncharacterized protein n=1 Tax=Chlamydomonas eustigma TaxID=1157962 RepID=A0A250WUK8_9CHLO|nr:hypothetical protein CEUSTIGMA_g1895.t1 [Chlamydomonas eustigma]|eukprot:GAX74446.1 hypothetical protein CEUSTIGMA_g1895.t1 [Chlamydomonas eustigma]